MKVVVYNRMVSEVNGCVGTAKCQDIMQEHVRKIEKCQMYIVLISFN